LRLHPYPRPYRHPYPYPRPCPRPHPCPCPHPCRRPFRRPCPRPCLHPSPRPYPHVTPLRSPLQQHPHQPPHPHPRTRKRTRKMQADLPGGASWEASPLWLGLRCPSFQVHATAPNSKISPHLCTIRNTGRGCLEMLTRTSGPRRILRDHHHHRSLWVHLLLVRPRAAMSFHRAVRERLEGRHPKRLLGHMLIGLLRRQQLAVNLGAQDRGRRLAPGTWTLSTLTMLGQATVNSCPLRQLGRSRRPQHTKSSLLKRRERSNEGDGEAGKSLAVGFEQSQSALHEQKDQGPD